MGYYFITICTKNRIDYFGWITKNKMTFSKIGNAANKCWLEIPRHYPNVRIDEH